MDGGSKKFVQGTLAILINCFSFNRIQIRFDRFSKNRFVLLERWAFFGARCNKTTRDRGQQNRRPALKKNSTFYMGIHSELDTYHGRVTQYLRNEVRHSVCYEMRQCAPDFQFRGVNTAESRRHFRVRTYTTWRQFLLASTADARGWRQGRRQLVASVEISVL